MAQTGPNFVLIDHSLKDVGGHNHQYAVDLLSAAESLGYRPVLAVNRRFSGQQTLPDTWLVRPLFPHAWDAKDWLGPDGKRRHPLDLEGRPLPVPGPRPGLFEKLASLAAWLWQAGRDRERQQRLRAFGAACTELFQAVPCGAGSLVFLPSVSDFDFLALIRFLATDPRTLPVDWHVQFHFDIFTGRFPDYARQTRQLRVIQQQFSSALAAVAQHRLHFYVTTEALAAQYQRLEVAEFRVLPYPYNGRLAQRSHRDRVPAAPLRVTCPGVIRREKGKRQIGDLVRSLWHEHLATGQLQLVFQGRPGQLRRYLPRSLARHSAFEQTASFTNGAPLVVVPHPLEVDDYFELVLRADLGLFLYDARRYYARCSGILVEMLAAGVPVIVPAGCWLADQIAEPIYRQLDELRRRGFQAEESTGARLRWQTAAGANLAADPNLAFADSRRAATVDVSVPAGASDLLFSLTWNSSNEPGHYVRVEAEQVDQQGRTVRPTQPAILGRRASEAPVAALFRLGSDAAQVRLRLSNAYADQPLQAQASQIHWLAAAPATPAGFPAGQVGLIAAAAECVPDLLRDITEHYAHYQRTAREFAEIWKVAHAPQRTIELLQACSASAKSVLPVAPGLRRVPGVPATIPRAAELASLNRDRVPACGWGSAKGEPQPLGTRSPLGRGQTTSGPS